jgi:galactokinase
LPDRVIAFAPGRVNLIGEHTDYNGGLALPFAIGAGVTVTARARAAATIEAVACDLGERDAFPLADVQPAPGWRAFVRGAVAELRLAGLDLRGASLAITGTVPRDAGLSSSAALEVALCLALIGLTGEPPPDRIALAQLCSRIENRWVGARTGLLDQIASLCGAERHAVLIDFAALAVRSLPFEPDNHLLVTLDSGDARLIARSGYNERRAECERACAALGVERLSDAELAETERLPQPLGRRARHVLSENARVRAAVDALERRDLEALGRLLNASHASLRDDYEISTPAVEAAIAHLREAGAIGARILGGGFGGHVLGLLPPGATPPAGATVVTPGPGAQLL